MPKRLIDTLEREYNEYNDLIGYSFFQKIRGKGLTCQNIKSGWKGAGLNPFSPRQVLNNLPTPLLPPPSTPNTPANPEDLDLSLLNSSPPNDIELRQANKYRDMQSELPIRLKALNAENAILRKELQEYKELLETRKKRKNGKRIKLKGEFVFSTEEVLKIIEEAEQTPLPKRRRGRPSKRQIDQVEEEMEEEEDSDSSVGSVIVVDHPVALVSLIRQSTIPEYFPTILQPQACNAVCYPKRMKPLSAQMRSKYEREDQDKINRFSRLHQRELGLEDELKLKNKEKEDLDDVSGELELADEE
ncbi:hypothetical protein DID88_000441 [Monilinia fructigena]|uniref:Uncharacterized protein n=1 Tax=Monilinia fructigena TaxID=38457 RepID=A0A395IHK9_9HELO|nr:hypothetical protein DID88_000441 [Monilinia fructigena]